MLKRNLLSSAILAAVAAGSVPMANAEVEISGYLKNETAAFTTGGQFIGEANTTTDTQSHHGGLMKFENSARLFINGDFEEWGEAFEDSSWHMDLNFIIDPDAEREEFRYEQAYSEHDWFRELYVDTSLGDVSLRLGKQQVVWGTADGIKLLDIINPTDFRELNQNTMEDARIPVWMVNAEADVGEVGNVQFILAQNRPNRIVGLNSTGAQGHPFVLLGVDSITGPVNGFLNVTPALSRVANSFSLGAQNGSFDINAVNGVDGTGDAIASGLNTFTNLTVDGFAANTQQVNGDGSIRANGTAGGAGGAVSGGVILNNIAQNAPNLPAGNANNNVTNLVTATYDPNTPNSAFEYMPNATFSTFNGFSGTAAASGVLSRYVTDYPAATTPNTGFRYKANLDNGFNFSVNYFYHYDANPSVDVQWVDSVDGSPIQKLLATQAAGGPDTTVANALSEDAFTNDATRNAITIDGNGNATNSVTVLLRDPDTGAFYGQIDPTTNAASANAVAARQAVLEFKETLNRIHSLGGSFDFSVDSMSVPLVVRGEFLYDKGVKVPVINRKLLGIGDIQGALKTQDADFFKYVIGVDMTVATNMLVSAQFIQFRNLDYVNQSRTCTTQSNAQGSTTNSFDCSTYTGDQATLHLTNGLNRAEENKEFVSLFFSKPFGAEQQHRWNNIFIAEDTGGYWNRFDIEYAFSDNFIGSFELNHYFGDDNSTFGQLEASSSIQFGMKWIID